uniref:Testis-expressed sequence 9 protein n=1 Tax=Musca domestica TaxID=7370 RepID=A0A1I8MWS5_MUSDO
MNANRVNSGNANHSRFNTYQKSKGQSTFLRKRGSGDGPSPEMMEGCNRQFMQNPKERFHMTMGRDTYRQGNRQANEPDNQSPRITTTAPTPTPPPAIPSSSLAQHSSVIKSHIRKYPPPAATSNTTARGNETFRASNQNRFANGRAPQTNTSTFTIKYRNPKFVKSPSLEVLLKDECSAIRSQTLMESAQMNGSVSSVAPEDLQSNGRQSQASNATIGSKKNVSTDGLIKFLKSKVTILEDDHSRISEELGKQKELLERALEQAKAMEKQRDQATSKNNALKEQLAKVEAQLEQANQNNKEQSKEHLKQQKELETAKREIKILTQNNKNLEKRLYRSNEDLESSRTALSEMKKSEKELQEKSRLDLDAKEKQIKGLKKQRADLLNAYKKQLFLIDNLKRQNICLEQAKMLEFGEKEFSKILEWDMKS